MLPRFFIVAPALFAAGTAAAQTPSFTIDAALSAPFPSGLTAGDSDDTVHTTADGIITGFQQQLGANTVRLPVNPQSVNSDWWSRYKGAVDAALAHGMKVILGYWEANKDGLVDDMAAWNTRYTRLLSWVASPLTTAG